MSSRLITDLYRTAQPIFAELINRAKFGDWQAFITDGFRSNQEQDLLWQKGRTVNGKVVTNAKGGDSLHNYGLAVDLAFKNIKTGEVKWDLSLYQKTAVIAKTLGIEWGGDWRSFVDNPHFQYTENLGLDQIKKGARPTGVRKVEDAPKMVKPTDIGMRIGMIVKNKDTGAIGVVNENGYLHFLDLQTWAEVAFKTLSTSIAMTKEIPDSVWKTLSKA